MSGSWSSQNVRFVPQFEQKLRYFPAEELYNAMVLFGAVVGIAKTLRAGNHCLDSSVFKSLTGSLESGAGLIETETYSKGPEIDAGTMDPVARRQSLQRSVKMYG